MNPRKLPEGKPQYAIFTANDAKRIYS